MKRKKILDGLKVYTIYLFQARSNHSSFSEDISINKTENLKMYKKVISGLQLQEHIPIIHK